MKLISDKASDQYEKDKQAERGLCIEEAYVGPAEEMQAFMDNPRHSILVLRDDDVIWW